MEIEIELIAKNLIRKYDEEKGYFRVVYRANGNLLYQDMMLNKGFPDENLKRQLMKFAKRHLTTTHHS